MQELYNKLTPVRSRQRAVRIVRLAAQGLFVGAIVATVLAVAGSVSGVRFIQFAGWGALAIGPVAGIVLAIARSEPWSVAAQAVDRHFRLDDRAQSAVTFLEKGQAGGMYALQIQDTIDRVTPLDTKSAVPFRFTKSHGMSVLIAVGAALVLAYLPVHQPPPTAKPNEASPTKSPEKAPPKAKPTLPTSVTWQPATNDRVLQEFESSESIDEMGSHGASDARLEFDLRHIERKYTPTFKQTSP